MMKVIDEFICTEIKSMNTHNNMYPPTDGMESSEMILSYLPHLLWLLLHSIIKSQTLNSIQLQ